MITRPEGKREEAAGISKRYPARKPKLNRLAACDMRAAQACRQGCGIVCDDQVARAEQRCEFAARQMPHFASGINGQQLGRSPVRVVSGNHLRTSASRSAGL